MAAKKRDSVAEKNRMLSAIIKKYVTAYEPSTELLLLAFDCKSRPTLRKRMNRPQEMPLGVFRDVCNALKIPRDEILPFV